MKYILILFLLACSNYTSHQTKAKTHIQDKDYQKAIQEYEKHIEARLAVKNRPDWENPYIYLLDIGNIYLEQNNIEKALKYYEEAEAKNVTQGYVNERYLVVGKIYEKQGQLEQAVAHLAKYRERDPELFNLVLDRIAKELVRQEQRN